MTHELPDYDRNSDDPADDDWPAELDDPDYLEDSAAELREGAREPMRSSQDWHGVIFDDDYHDLRDGDAREALKAHKAASELGTFSNAGDEELPFLGEVYVRFPSTENDPDYESRLSREELIAGGAIDVILGRGMVGLEEAIAGETRINTGNLWASLEGTPALAATFERGPEAVFGAAGLIASEREVMRGYCLEALPTAEVAEFTGRTYYSTESLIKRASKALRQLSVTAKSGTRGWVNEGPD